jgi:hypothetical protein
MTTKTKTKTETGGNGRQAISPADVQRLFEDGYREVEILEDGRVREASRNGHDLEETVTRTLKTKRTWY